MNSKKESIIHLITTVERGGAELQLLQQCKIMNSKGFNTHIIFLKGRPELVDDFNKVGSTVDTSIANHSVFFQIFKLFLIRKSFQGTWISHLPRAELLTRISSTRPFVVMRHNAEAFATNLPSFATRALSRFVSNKALCVIAISNAVKDFLVENEEVREKSKIHVIYYVAPDSRSVKNAKPPKSAEPLSLVMVSRLVAQKDIPTALLAFRQLKDFDIKFTVNILGDGEQKVKLAELSSQLGLSKEIQWCGKLSNVSEIMANSSIFVHSSRYEGFGMVYLEAIIARLPIVTTANPAAIEVLGNEHPGLCPIGDYRALAQKIIEVSKHKLWKSTIKMQNERLYLFDANEFFLGMQTLICDQKIRTP
jgi:glycosyltransferase involved in cell wall biosynthesis